MQSQHCSIEVQLMLSMEGRIASSENQERQDNTVSVRNRLFRQCRQREFAYNPS